MIDFKREFGDDLANFVEKYFRINPNYAQTWPYHIEKKDKKKLEKMYRNFLSEFKEKDKHFRDLAKNQNKICEQMIASYNVYQEIYIRRCLAAEYLNKALSQSERRNASIQFNKMTSILDEANHRFYDEIYANQMHNVLCPEAEYLEAIAFCMMNDFLQEDFNWLICGSGAGKLPLSILKATKNSKVAAVDRANNKSRIFNNYFTNYFGNDGSISRRLTSINENYMQPELVEDKLNFKPNIVLYMFPTLYSLESVVVNALTYADDHAFFINNIVSTDLKNKDSIRLRNINPPSSAVIDFFSESDEPYHNYIKKFFRNIWDMKKENSLDELYQVVKMCEYEPFKFVSIEEIRLS